MTEHTFPKECIVSNVAIEYPICEGDLQSNIITIESVGESTICPGDKVYLQIEKPGTTPVPKRFHNADQEQWLIDAGEKLCLLKQSVVEWHWVESSWLEVGVLVFIGLTLLVS